MDREYTYQEASTYLRIHGARIDEKDQDTRKTNQVEVEEGWSYDEVKEIYRTMVKEQGVKRTFKTLNSPQMRESLHINPKIWKRLSEEIQAEIRAIRDQINEAEKDQKPKSKPIPPQYGLNRNIKKTSQVVNDMDHLTNMVNSFTLDNDTMNNSN
jgi:hypothetical protein